MAGEAGISTAFYGYTNAGSGYSHGTARIVNIKTVEIERAKMYSLIKKDKKTY